MGPDFMQMFQNFVTGAQSRFGQNFNPMAMYQNVMGNSCATPQQALQQLLEKGIINKAQYDKYLPYV